MSLWNTFYFQHDLKKLLKQIMESKRKRNPRFSQRAFALSIGLTTTTLNEILKGKRPLTKKSLAKIRTALEKDNDFEAALSSLRSSSPTLPEASEWYHMPLVELVTTDSFKEDMNWISQRLQISQLEVEQALKYLVETEALKRAPDNGLTANTNPLRVAHELSVKKTTQVTNQYLIKISDALNTLPSEETFSGFLTVAASKEDIDYIRKKSFEFMNECYQQLTQTGKKNQDVFVLNINFAPLTKKIKNEDFPPD